MLSDLAFQSFGFSLKPLTKPIKTIAAMVKPKTIAKPPAPAPAKPATPTGYQAGLNILMTEATSIANRIKSARASEAAAQQASSNIEDEMGKVIDKLIEARSSSLFGDFGFTRRPVRKVRAAVVQQGKVAGRSRGWSW